MAVLSGIAEGVLSYAPYVNFFLFLFLLWRFARKPAHGAAEKRSEDYKALYEKASASNREARGSLDLLEKKLAGLEGEIAQIEGQAQKTSAAYSQSLMEEAERMSEHLAGEAQRLAKREAIRAKGLLQEELWEKAKKDLLERVRLEFTVKKQKEYLWNSLSDVKNLDK